MTTAQLLTLNALTWLAVALLTHVALYLIHTTDRSRHHG